MTVVGAVVAVRFAAVLALRGMAVAHSLMPLLQTPSRRSLVPGRLAYVVDTTHL
jgi:hypothetical protein